MLTSLSKFPIHRSKNHFFWKHKGLKMKGYHQIITVFIIFLISLNFFISGTAAENSKRSVRQKRNVLCHLGLTGFISGIFYDSLNSVHKYDPMFIGSLLNGKLTNVEFQGLSTLINDSNIDVYCQNEMVVLDTLLSLTDVSVSCEWSQKVLLTFTGTITATVEDIQFQVDANLNMESGIVFDINVVLTKLDGIKLGFSGLGPLNPVIKMIGNLILDVFNREVSKKIGKVLKTTLESELGKYNTSF
ncbi:uncharacterized protein LOC129984605 isoform X2 [Argiope bruennichi]|uniref:uncharacterized protein LOC129984605 isoform X2 n=1 Tax=Argiope bruennichi TaxID=94029 RepID=UPI0024958255|nr:uncharacterized protein LOC129984605 isoform X2 [Argiope bruennichi]